MHRADRSTGGHTVSGVGLFLVIGFAVSACTSDAMPEGSTGSIAAETTTTSSLPSTRSTEGPVETTSTSIDTTPKSPLPSAAYRTIFTTLVPTDQGTPVAYFLRATDTLSDHIDVTTSTPLVDLPFGLPPGSGLLFTLDRNDNPIVTSSAVPPTGWPIDCLVPGPDADGDGILDHCDPYPDDGPLLAVEDELRTPDSEMTLDAWNLARAHDGLAPFGAVAELPADVETWCALDIMAIDRLRTVPEVYQVSESRLQILSEIADEREVLLAEFESTTGRTAADDPGWFAYDLDLVGPWWADQAIADSILLPAFVSNYACEAI